MKQKIPQNKLTMALRGVAFCHPIGTNFPHADLGESVVITAAAVPVIIASIEEVLDLVVANHRVTALDGIATASLPPLESGIRQ